MCGSPVNEMHGMSNSIRTITIGVETSVTDESHPADEVRRLTAELKKTTRELKEIKTQFEAIHDHHFQLTGLIDANGRLLMANRTALNLIGAELQMV